MISCKRVWDLGVKVLETSSSKGRKASLLKGRGAWTPYQPGLEIRCSVGPGNSMGQEISLWTWVVQHKGTISRCIQGHAHDVVLMVFEFMQHEGIQGKQCPRSTRLRVCTAVFAAQQVTYRS
jgi:hypothetical protein